MARKPRITPGGFVYHVLNRTAGRFKCFRTRKDFEAFNRLLIEAHQRVPLRLLSYCVMDNHWHFVVYPREEGEVTAFFRWLANTHAVRWRVSHQTVGYGHLYQGRFKSFPVEHDRNLLSVCRYVERNALTSGAVARAQDWPWSSLAARADGSDELRAILSPWPVPIPADWVERVNEALTPKEIERMQLSIRRSRPFGEESEDGGEAEPHAYAAPGRPPTRASPGPQSGLRKVG